MVKGFMLNSYFNSEEFDEIITAQNICEEEELNRLRSYLAVSYTHLTLPTILLV